MIFDIHIIFSSQSIWEVFLSYLNLMSPASHLTNLALQDSYRIFNQDCELVSQLPIVKALRSLCVRLHFPYECESYPGENPQAPHLLFPTDRFGGYQDR